MKKITLYHILPQCSDFHSECEALSWHKGHVDPCDLVWWPKIIKKEVDLPKMAAPGSIKQQQLDWQSTWRIRVALIWRNVLWALSHPFLIYELAEHSKNDDFAQNKAEASFSSPSMHYTPFGQNEENVYRTTSYLKMSNTRGWLAKLHVSCQDISEWCRIF